VNSIAVDNRFAVRRRGSAPRRADTATTSTSIAG
jgi:hypothetical protein